MSAAKAPEGFNARVELEAFIKQPEVSAMLYGWWQQLKDFSEQDDPNISYWVMALGFEDEVFELTILKPGGESPAVKAARFKEVLRDVQALADAEGHVPEQRLAAISGRLRRVLDGEP